MLVKERKKERMLSSLINTGYLEVRVELIQNQTHGACQVGHIGGFMFQRILKHIKVTHPLHRKAVAHNVNLPWGTEDRKYATKV